MNGILSIQHFQRFVQEGIIYSDPKVDENQLQPNSIDLRLGSVAYRVRSSFLSEKTAVIEKINDLVMYSVDLTDGAVLEKGKVYIIPLLEALDLPEWIHGKTNPKSSTGRLDIFTRIITDYNYRFNEIMPGYRGKLFLELAPRSFTIKARKGDSLSQLRLIAHKNLRLTDSEIFEYYKKYPLLYDNNGKAIPIDKIKIKDGLFMSINLSKTSDDHIIGYKSRKNSNLLEIGKTDHYACEQFWESISAQSSNDLILEPEEFYIFSSKEGIVMPGNLCGEMIPYDIDSGELRIHYAGFFDSGFGYNPLDKSRQGAKVVLEVRSHDVPFIVEDGQTLCRIMLDKVPEMPNKLYGSDLSSNYQNQGLRLSKQFKK